MSIKNSVARQAVAVVAMERPYVLLAQPSRFDPSRAPAGKHTVWAYCHLPNGSTFDLSARIEAQIERFAPGFRERVLARSVLPPSALEARNRNLVGGDLNGGAATLWRLAARPVSIRTWRCAIYEERPVDANHEKLVHAQQMPKLANPINAVP